MREDMRVAVLQGVDCSQRDFQLTRGEERRGES